MLMIDPVPRFTMWAPTCWDIAKIAVDVHFEHPSEIGERHVLERSS